MYVFDACLCGKVYIHTHEMHAGPTEAEESSGATATMNYLTSLLETKAGLPARARSALNHRALQSHTAPDFDIRILLSKHLKITPTFTYNPGFLLFLINFHTQLTKIRILLITQQLCCKISQRRIYLYYGLNVSPPKWQC